MRSSEFLTLIAANANKSKNLRSYFGPWPCSITLVPYEVAGHIGRVISLIQQQIDANLMCDKASEYLLIYNLQPLALSLTDEHVYYSIDMLRKPIASIKNVKNKVGQPFQLVFDSQTQEVMNNSKFLIDQGIATLEEILLDKLDSPASYGSYEGYCSPATFVAIHAKSKLDPELVFKGKHDLEQFMLDGKAFENLLEARYYLKKTKSAYCAILELAEPIKSITKLKQIGLSKFAVKIMDLSENHVVVNSDPALLAKEEPIEDQLFRLKNAFGMSETTESFNARTNVASFSFSSPHSLFSSTLNNESIVGEDLKEKRSVYMS